MGIFEIVEFEKSKDKMKALAHEKVDVIINNLISGQKYIRQGGYSNIKILDEISNTIVKKEDLRIGINKENKLLFSIINKSMNAITREEKEFLYNKWFTAKVEIENSKRVLSLTDEEKEYLREKKEIIMCIDPDWMPFEKNEKGKHIGMSADYFRHFEKSINIPIRMLLTKTWTESLSLGKKRDCDIFSLVTPTPQRFKYLDFTKPYLKTPLVVVTNNNALFISSLWELRNKKVGLVKNYGYAELLKSSNSEVKFVDVENLKEGLEKVEAGETFAFIGGLATTGFQIQNNYLGQLKIAGKIDVFLDLSIGTRNDEPILKSIFNKAISKISMEDHQNILNKWVSINYQEGVQYKTIWQYLIIILIITIILILVYRQFLLKGLNKKLNEKVKIEIEKNIRQNEILSQQSKMAAMGEMLGNIAHQWRQPLSTISTAATGAKLQKEMHCLSDEQLNSALTAINTSAQYLSSTIDDFREFLNPSNSKTSEFNISNTIKKVLNLMIAQIKAKDIEIIQNIEEFKLTSIENELIQVLINILNNAKDILLTKDNQKRLIFINTYKKENVLIIEILDNAGGIKNDIIDRIFEPYFTTKHKSQGTGIGLYISEEITRTHLNGTLHVNNENFSYEGIDYIGAKFTIEISI